MKKLFTKHKNCVCRFMQSKLFEATEEIKRLTEQGCQPVGA